MSTSTVYINKDTYSDYENQDTNYGTDNEMFVRYDVSSVYKPYITYLEFDISSEPVANKIESVKLYTYVKSSYLGIDLSIRRLTSVFTENTLTWNISPTYTNTNSKSWGLSIGTSYAWRNIDITNLYKDAKNVGSTLGLRISRDSNADRLITFSTRETVYDSYIVITYYTNVYYVKISGNDTLTGDSWSNAWETINKVATTATDDSLVHIGFGTYNAEPAGNKIAPQNAGSSGIKYLCETATTGGGTGSVIVEKN